MWYDIRLNFQINTLLRALFFQKWGLFSHPARLEAALSYADVQLPKIFDYWWRSRVEIKGKKIDRFTSLYRTTVIENSLPAFFTIRMAVS